MCNGYGLSITITITNTTQSVMKLCLMIRRKYRTNKRLLEKEVFTLHSKLKKKDTITTKFVVEEDPNKYTSSNKYHSHLIVDFKDYNHLIDRLQTFIGGDGKVYEIDKSKGLERIFGKWGEIDLHPYHEYSDKYLETKSNCNVRTLV